jgi:hypothetical protein
MTGSNVVHLWPRLISRPMKLQLPPRPAMEVVEYETAHIRSDVCFVQLERALLRAGLTCRADPVIGLVIEPVPDLPEAS